jgi:DNA-binding transcriptional ArsR family regulator/uncharacterized protein YndB with AHSA1/START domain
MDDEVFRALADVNRRTLLDRLFERDGQTLTELEAALRAMTRFGVMKHLRVLEAAGLVTSRKVGRERHHYLNPVPIRRIHDRWLDRYRARAADALNDFKETVEVRAMLETIDQGAGVSERPPAYVHSVFIRATPEQVWRGLTESEFTTRYYYQSTVDSDWRVGSPIEYRIGGELALEGVVLESDPPRKLVMSFHAVWDEQVAADPHSRMTWEIEEAAPGVSKLTVVHDGFEARTETYTQVTGGWPWIVSGLKSLLETGQALTGSEAPATA